MSKPSARAAAVPPGKTAWTFAMLFAVLFASADGGDAVKPATAARGARTSFENCQPGGIGRLVTEAGVWSAEAGHAEVDDKHANSGSQCLHILGGEQRIVEFAPGGNEQLVGQITFAAERWTKRSPFSFRIEQCSSGNWREIYNGDRQVVIGHFRTKVRVAFDQPKVERLRFVCTSPPGSGLLIDDFRITPPSPMRVAAVQVEPFTLPALVGNPACPLLRVRVDVEGNRQPLSLTSLGISLAGTTDVEDLASLRAFLVDSENLPRGDDASGLFANASAFAQSGDPQQQLRLGGRRPLVPGPNYIWVTGQLTADADIDHKLQVKCLSVELSDGTRIQPAAATGTRPQRMGIALRRAGDDGVHTYRIPGLATTNQGTLIAVYDVRRRSSGDLPGDIDIGMSRSTDGGRCWEPMRVIMDMGDDPRWRYDGIGDPAVLVDRETGRIWVAATWSHGNRSWNGSGPGLSPEQTGQLMMVHSDDDGQSWSKPVNITRQVKRPEWCFLLQGPGKGITMQDGTIVFAAQYQDPEEKSRLPHSTIIYSRDHGQSWQIGTGAADDTTEAQVVEIEPGVLMLNCRYNRRPVRVVMITRDMGKSWQRHFSSERSLIEPRACMASLIDVDGESGREPVGRLLFSNPDSTSGRDHLTIKGSRDAGMQWHNEHRLLLDEGPGRGYSCMSMIDEDTVGILYEGSQADLTFQRIPLAEIFRPAKGDTPGRQPAAEQGLRAGAATLDITPKLGVSLDGPISKNGPVTGIHDHLFARAIVLDDGRTRIAIVVCDACIIEADVFDRAKATIHEQIGLPPEYVLATATHTHAAPRSMHIATGTLDNEYHEFLAARIAEAVRLASQNLAPAQLGFGVFDKPEFVRCRRFLCEPGSVGPNPFGERGERCRSVSGHSSSVIKPAGPVDPQISILSLQHAGGSPLAALANFSVHYCGGYARGQVSADYFGFFAAELQQQLPSPGGHPAFVGIMSNGTSGNTGSITLTSGPAAPFARLEQAGRLLAQQAAEVIRGIEHRRDVSLAVSNSEIELAVRRPDPQRIAWAEQVLADPHTALPHRWTRVFAQECLHLSAYPKTKRLKLQAVRIGDVGIAAIPCEVFAETGLAIKRESPLAHTFTMELANGYGGYLPPPEQHEIGGYETWPARSSYLEVNAEPKIRSEVLRLLQSVRLR